MKAIVCERYGPPDVLRLQEVEKPRPHTQTYVLCRWRLLQSESIQYSHMVQDAFLFPRAKLLNALRSRESAPGQRCATL